MSESTVCSVLRVIAVGMVVLGVVLTTQVAIALFGASGQFPSGAFQGVVAPALFTQLSIATWGLALYAASARLASMIVA
jgi:hypothetical protein